MKKTTKLLMGLAFLFGMVACKPAETIDLSKIADSLVEECIPSSIEESLALPSIFDGASITYESSNTNVIGLDGTVTRTSEDVDVYITITLTLNEKTYTKIIKVTVKADDSIIVDPGEIVASDLTSAQIESLNNALEALNNNNYQINSTESMNYLADDDYDYTTETLIKYDDSLESQSFVEDGETYEFFVDYSGDSIVAYFDDEDGYYAVDESDEFFAYYLSMYGYCQYFYDEFKVENIGYADGYYVVKSDKLDTVAADFIGISEEDNEHCDYIKFKIENDKITELSYKSHGTYVEDGESSAYEYTVNLIYSNYGNVTVTLPDNIIVETDYLGTEDDPIDVYAAAEIISKYEDKGESSEQAYVIGTVKTITGPDSHSSYSITFEAAGVNFQVYSLKLASGQEAPKAGDEIVVKGYLYKFTNTSGTIYEVAYTSTNKTNPTLVKNNGGSTVTPVDPNEIVYGTEANPIDVATAIKTLDALNGVGNKEIAYVIGTISTNPTVNSRGNYSFYLEAGDKSFQVYSMVLPSDMDAPKLGDVVVVKGCLLMFNTTYEIGYSRENGTNPTLVRYENMVYANTIELNTTSWSIPVGANIDELLAQLVVKYYDAEGKATTLSSTDYIYTTTVTDFNEAGTYVVTIKYGDLTKDIALVIKSVQQPLDSSNASRLVEAVDKLNTVSGIPTTGTVDVLVIPVSFINKTYDSNYKEIIQKTFTGTSEETGYESLQSYYYKSSYGKLTIVPTILDVYNTNAEYSKYETGYSNGEYLDQTWMNAALSYYDSSIDYAQFDKDNDGYIDCVYIVYLAPYVSDYDDSMYWAYTSYDERTEKYDGKDAGCYMFASIDFCSEPIKYKSYGASRDTYVNYNAVTFIHETGHCLGLDDYYDYGGTGSDNGGLGGPDMMDHNIGDHNVWSKAILGWVSPKVVYNFDAEVTLSSGTETGDGLIIAKNWSGNGDFFTELYLVELYTPTGLNEFFKGYDGVFSKVGVKIYHIDATLATGTVEGAYDVTKYHNSNDSHKLITLIEADGNNSISTTGAASDSDLFTAGKSYAAKWYSSSKTAFTISVTSLTNTSATISISY